MNGRNLGALLAGGVFLVAGVVAQSGHESGSTAMFALGAVLGSAVIVAVFKGWNPLRNLWIGPTLESMQKEYRDLDAMLWESSDGRGDHLSSKEWWKLEKRREKLKRMLSEYGQLNRED